MLILPPASNLNWGAGYENNVVGLAHWMKIDARKNKMLILAVASNQSGSSESEDIVFNCDIQ